MILFNRFALAEFRRLIGYSQTGLAKADGRSTSYISALESGDRTNPSMETIKALSAALEVDPRALYVEVPA